MNNPLADKPAPHHPTLREEDRKNGLYCFLNDKRACGADCMAFIAAPDGADYRDQQWANCLLLVNAHRGGKHLIVLASAAGQAIQNAKNEAADRVRTQPGPPSPTGR